MKRGFGIAETLISSTIIASLVLSFLGITSVISHSAGLSYQQTVAAQLAQKRIENIRFLVEEAWNNSRQQETLTLGSSEWVPITASDVAAQTVDINSIRYTSIVDVSRVYNLLPPLHITDESGTADYLSASDSTESLFRKLRVTVTWKEGTVERSYQLDTVLTNWREGVL